MSLLKVMNLKSFEEMIEQMNRSNLPTIAVAAAEDHEVLMAVKEAAKMELAEFHLFGDGQKINEYAEAMNLPLDSFKITNESDPVKASRKAVESVSSGESQILMKGLVPTAVILKAVLDKEIGLRTNRVLSHVAMFEIDGYDRMIFLTDAAMNIAPPLDQKVQIIQNVIDIARSVGVEKPKIASIAAVETVNPNMQATIDAALLSKMADRGQIANAIIDGPLALDNAISIEAAKHKGIESEVAGLADVLLVPNIEVGNVLYKSLVYFSKVKVGAVIAGAQAPIVLTSRADSHQTKLNSIVLAVLSADKHIR